MSNSVSISLSYTLTYRDFVKFPTLHYNSMKGKKHRFFGGHGIHPIHAWLLPDPSDVTTIEQNTMAPPNPLIGLQNIYLGLHMGPFRPNEFFYFDLFVVFVICCNATEQFSAIQQVRVFDNPQRFCYWGRAFSYWNSSRYLHKSRRYYHSTAKCIYALCLSQFYLTCCLIYNMTCFTKLSDHYFVCHLHWQFTERGSSLNARYVWF